MPSLTKIDIIAAIKEITLGTIKISWLKMVFKPKKPILRPDNNKINDKINEQLKPN